MANYACIAIGINQYQFFQPLSYANTDAQALQQFLVEEAGLPSNRCLLLTDTSPPIGDRSTYPSRENISSWIDAWCLEVLQPGDILWFFFSGYGVSTGKEDYLMPIDSNPADVANTGISVRSLFKYFKSLKVEGFLVMLDINRSQGMQADVAVGQETIELAQNLGIATLLSCQLDEFSHEAAALNHGLFTATLLEALRYDPSMTLASLDQFLRDRLPQLSEHHWQPSQTPLTAISSWDANRPLIVPLLETIRVSRIANTDEHNLNLITALPKTSNRGNNVTAQAIVGQEIAPVSVTPAPATTGAETDISSGALVHSPVEPSPLDIDETPWWLQLLFWGAGTALVLGMIAGVATKVFNQQQPVETSTSTPSPTLPASSAPIPVAKSSPGASPSGKKEPVVPTSSPERLQANKAVLDQAKSLIQGNQASKFSQAIQEAQKIKSGDPLYEQASADITRWSQVILDLAEARAKKGEFLTAIAAAQLIPSNQSIYGKSQKAIARWQKLAQQQRANRITLQAAKGLISERQASSYNRAITAANKVQLGEPGYADAQKLIAQWSRRIYLLAQSRASRGEFAYAIETATLVPQNTPSYKAAKNAIAIWKVKSNK